MRNIKKTDCCVPNCEMSRNGCIMFYSLPDKDEKLCKAWKRRIGNPAFDNKAILSSKTYEICENHFHYMCKTGLNSQLHENSLPTLNLPNFNKHDSTRENCFLHRNEENDFFDERNLKFNLKIEDFESICRICYSKGVLYNLTESKLKNESILKLLQRILQPDNVISNEYIPQNICLNCLKAVLIANFLIDQIKSSNYNYIQLLNRENSEKYIQLSYPNITDLKSALFDCQLKNNLKKRKLIDNEMERKTSKYRINNMTSRQLSNEDQNIDSDISDFIKFEVISNLVNSKEEFDVNDKNIKTEEKIYLKSVINDDLENFVDKKIKIRKLYNCEKCVLDFIGFRSFSRHNRDKHPKLYNCSVCNKKLISSEKLALHRWTHLQMECKICHKKVKKTWLKGHMRTHEKDYKPKPWKKVEKLCPLCGKMLSTSAYKDHMAGHTGPKKYKCKLCLFASSFAANLRRHQALHTGAKPYLCTNCGYSCNQKAQLEVHSKQHVVSVTPLTCPFCPETFRTRYDRRLHSVRHSNGNTVAGKPSNSGSGKTAHTAFDKKYYNAAHGQYVCPTCPVMCQNRVGLVRHLRNEHGDFDAGCLPCGYCDKKFSCQSSLGLHIRTQHHTATPYICDICDKAFKSRPSLREHILIHTGERPHKCDLCPSAFRQHQHLTSHKLRMHDDRKPYSCDFCDKAFKCTFSLKEHIRLHTGETIKCEHCEKTFKQSSNKYKHMREVHNIRRSIPKTK